MTVAQVVGKQLLELDSQLSAKGVEIDIDEEVRNWLGQKGYDPKLGARPMGRLIEERIKKPLSEEILFGKLEEGGKVRVTLKSTGKSNQSDSELEFHYSEEKKKDRSKSKTSRGSKKKKASVR